MDRAYVATSATVFLLVTAAHALRLVYQVPARVGGAEVPMVVSWLGLLFAGGLALWALAQLRR
jgi:hypothetical protein